jgi:peroxiredoxin
VSEIGPAGQQSPPPADGNPPSTTPAPLDIRRYGWAVGILGAVLVIAFTVYTLTSHTRGTAGIPAGRQLRLFAAPLARSTLNGDANLNPPCTLARHDRRALNICLLVKRAPLVLGFFVTDASACNREVDTMQALAAQLPSDRVQFAAVAVHASHVAAARVVRAHHWTIPVAYDADGSVGALYGITACPLLELAGRGGTVTARLLGEHWLSKRALAAQVRTLLARPR